MHRKKYYFGGHPLCFQLTESVQPVQHRHRDVRHNYVRGEFVSGVNQSLSVLDTADQIEFILEQGPQTLGEHLVIISQKNSRATHHHLVRGTRATSVVPACGLDVISNVPCSNLTRSSALASPIPLSRLAFSISNPRSGS